MATRRRRRTTRRRKTTTRRRTRRAAPRRRTTRRRRRRNPSFPVKETAIAGVGGLAAGAAAYALDGQDLEPYTKAAILAGAGLVLGGLIGGWHKAVGAGVAGAGVGLGGKMALEKYMAESKAKKQTSGVGRLPDYGVRKYGRTPRVPYYRNMPQMGAVATDLGAVTTDIGSVEAELRGVEATLY
jgi:hypothetical protein